MTLSTVLPIFPGFKPGQSFTGVPTPVRSPTWNFKETAKWNNSRQQAVNGRVSVVKYWSNPLWDWDWTYGFIIDDPSGQNYGGVNSFYPQPIPATDLGILKGFYNGMSAGGNNFLYQPSDYQVGGVMTATAYSCTNNIVTYYGANTAQLGQYAFFNAGGPLFHSNLPILFCGPTFISCYSGSTANIGITAITPGTIQCAQLLSPTDGNWNTELVHTIGAYPTLPLTGTPPQYTLVTESVQVIDISSLLVYANGGPLTSSYYSVLPADTVSPYQGIILNFSVSGTPTPPVTASFNYYKLCRFSEDAQEWENFLALLYSASSVKFEEDRI